MPRQAKDDTEMSRISPQQRFMLQMFADGWAFKLFNDRRGSWNTYWSLVRNGYIDHRQTVEHAGKPAVTARLTDRGKQAMMKGRK